MKELTLKRTRQYRGCPSDPNTHQTMFVKALIVGKQEIDPQYRQGVWTNVLHTILHQQVCLGNAFPNIERLRSLL